LVGRLAGYGEVAQRLLIARNIDGQVDRCKSIELERCGRPVVGDRFDRSDLYDERVIPCREEWKRIAEELVPTSPGSDVTVSLEHAMKRIGSASRIVVSLFIYSFFRLVFKV